VADDFSVADDDTFRTNAWCGEAASSRRGPDFDQWGSRKVKKATGGQSLSAKDVDDTDWKDDRVGWGIVLPERDLPGADKARAADAPECIRTLLAERSKIFAALGGAPVFRYRSDLELGFMRRYAADGRASDPGLGGARGIGPVAVPRYLLIVGSPEEIPWRFQYRLQLDAYVGRLDLDEAGLERYVAALLADWTGSKTTRGKPVVWSVDYGAPDISWLMRRTIADKLAQAFTNDRDHDFDMTGGVLSDEDATQTQLVAALGQRRPAFVATSSHGATFPFDDSATMAGQLGLPVDNAQAVMDPKALTATWSPHGSIWYAHACCSAGCDAVSSFAGTATADSTLGRTLAALSKVGARTAPLPRHLLGGSMPARAFIGHVEPTFDWTLRDPRNGQTTTARIIDAFYGQLHRAARPPVGYAMATYHRAVGGLWRDYADSRDDQDEHVSGAEERVKRAKLVASDLEAMVLLGDPTVRCL
jgi:hypothetical protein